MSQKEHATSNEFEAARDELFSHIHRCGVLKATREQQEEWIEDTTEYLSERYASISEEQVTELRTMGLRFCRPVIDYVSNSVADEEKEETANAAAA